MLYIIIYYTSIEAPCARWLHSIDRLAPSQPLFQARVTQLQLPGEEHEDFGLRA